LILIAYGLRLSRGWTRRRFATACGSASRKATNGHRRRLSSASSALGTADVSWEHKRVEAADRERAARTLTHQGTEDRRREVARLHLAEIRRTLGMGVRT
jgi:hypothetical protein